MVIGLLLLSAAPILATFAISLTHWDLLTAPDPAGLDNYTKLFDDPRFLTAIRNTAFYTIVSVPLGMAISLGWHSRSTRRSPGSRGSGRCTSCRS